MVISYEKKSDISILFPQFKTLVEKFFHTPLVSLFSDNGGEYIGLIPYLQQNAISHFTSPPHTPEQNGVAERRHRHIVETGLSLLHYANLPLNFWSHAFQTAVHLINHFPTPILDYTSPYDGLYNNSPTYTRLKPFGCVPMPNQNYILDRSSVSFLATLPPSPLINATTQYPIVSIIPVMLNL